MTDFYMLCKWENLQNWQCIKYLFSPTARARLSGHDRAMEYRLT